MMLSSQPVNSEAKPDILAAAADSLGKVVLIHHDIHAMFFLIHKDAADFGRRQCIDYECRGIIRPQNDVHPLPGQLASYSLHS